MRHLVVISGILVLLAGGGQARSATGGHAKAGLTFTASADAYVSAAAPRRNFGRSKALRIGNRPATRSYLRFQLAKIDAPITRATLRLFTRSSSRGFEVRAAGAGWSERSITFANAPRPGRQITGSGRYRARTWVSIDVTTLAKGNGPVSLVLAGADTAFASRESGAKRPQLIVQATPPTLIAAGDIADCAIAKDAETAALVAKIPGTVAALGDLAYEYGTLAEFNACYQPTWGAFKARTRPAPGNHEYEHGTNGAGYFAYWGAVAGNPSQGWYSYDLGGWHLISLNSNCNFVGGCQTGSAQETWLRSDLAAHKNQCTAAYWHHPMFSATPFQAEPIMMGPLWQALYDGSADLVLVGHSHNYERFAPQTAGGAADPARGIREFIVGTGGREFHTTLDPTANLEVANASTWGVLRLTLRNSGYDWKFLPIAGQTFTDSGSQACH